jgi:Anthrone oxygenase
VADAIGALAILACSFFAGAATYISLVEHPARLSCETEVAARQWAPSYKRATVMQVTLAVLATLAGVVRWFGGGGAPWLIGALLIVAVIPFTLLAILPTNNRLLEAGRDLRSEETRQLLEVWGRLHAVRSILSVVATIVYLYALVGSWGGQTRG